MAKIEELSEKLANQIAAGEVIERPASVVKELVENSIDAGSTQIDILIEEAGLKKIQIIDNGDGIEAEDVKNAFKRHATSKIHTRDDLFRIRTLGFRGEALPSIASVSEVILETATGSGAGTYISLKGGDIEEERPNPSRKGTSITVSNLFFNTPARLKYVKTLQTELATIGDIVNRLAMSHPMIAFRLVHDGNQMLRTSGKGDLKQTLAGIYGVAIAKKMRLIENEDLDFNVKGFISLPEVTRASRNYMSIMINGRYIKNYLLNKAIIAGYRSKLMVGRFPIVALDITMDPLLVDVNVHPTKQEVRISKEKELMGLIEDAIHQALSKEQLIPEAMENFSFKKPYDATKFKAEQTKIDLNVASSTKPENQPAYQVKEPLVKEKPTDPFQPIPFKHEELVEEEAAPFEDTQDDQVAESFLVEPTVTESIPTMDRPISELEELHEEPYLNTATNLLKREAQQTEKAASHLPTLEYIGQMHGTYLFAQNENGLYILDQHAAQERIKYEYFRKKIGEVSRDLQDLLVPMMLDYPNSDAIKIKENQPALEEIGIFLEPFGQNSFLLRSHPVWFNKGEEEEIVREMIDLLLEQGTVNVAKFREATAIMMSCKGSIKANHYLNDQEARALLVDLAKTENPYNCPHGRPVLIQFTNKDMEKMFKRIQDPH
ncbi:DNA mismatch repair endonuclease MutL [Carnobacterium divergens]|uniref:DNA mismatch repair endonuclease MutL n=1 Tax=Carnobacterium divergens TaxID=2748 RepID=UPI000D4FE732|nr:DNA mismatch repair endonuclease MutL [Carnobacterium divergens]MCO6017345.1 DNA mismatch repair endonuclease MutL [Carnobacterium divergens]TFI61210.1 DNA mismatch repair endonuclease MutL [Carnobacterium divergens]TFI88232.1 DNA mismatch repair endonuclease MutL [Carnobacterium divergens]TFJ02800.1 DNA mismatch repair endonuclease MutL [Carnobacterium divergens]TFJ04349.1 DNA mismatch repair endonuclease MutL [Carnobacterium divergens]